MLPGLTVPADLTERALGWAFLQRLESVDVEALKLLKANAAAKMMSVPVRVFRRLAKEHIDLGEKTSRYSLKDIKALIEKRRIKSQP